MLKRVLTGAALFALGIPVLLLYKTPLFDAVIALLSFAATYEALKCAGVQKKYICSVPALALSAVVPLFIRRGDLFFRASFAVLMTFVFYLLFTLIFAGGRHTFNDAAATLFSSLYTVTAFSCILLASALPQGGYIFPLIFIGAFSTDTFAYFTGRLLGRHKIPLAVSPNKTVEGCAGGVVFCVAAFNVYGMIVASTLSKGAVEPDYLLLSLTGVIVSVVAQLGDLAASAFKRSFGVKDFGSLFPGHGGVIDRFDSVMAVAPFIYLIASALFHFFGAAVFNGLVM